MCIQRLGTKGKGGDMNEFDDVFGISVMDDQLYVSDFSNTRIQIFSIAKKDAALCSEISY